MSHLVTIAAFVATLMVVSSVSAQGQAPAPAPALVSGFGPSTASPPSASFGPSPYPSFGPSAPEPASPEDQCMNALLNMSDCLSYVEAGSTAKTPDKNCCPELAGLLDSNPICLCQMLGSNITGNFGIKIDINKALKLPSACSITTPPTSLCSAVGYPVPAPESSKVAPPPGSEAGASSPSSGADTKSGAANLAGSAPALSLFVALASAFLSTFF